LSDHAIIRRYNRLSITKKIEINLLGVRRGGREREGGWRREERLAGNKLGKKLLEFNPILHMTHRPRVFCDN
jgi:hypothetical protein